ncbi:TPA: hypothetical protein ACIZCU_000918 [Legionella pneumophila]|nr:hypothetical protein [Legionella pneumophila]
MDECSYQGITQCTIDNCNRTPFLKDYGSIIYRSQFRRLSNKTQVFLNPYVDFPRTRLTHSIEAEHISRELSRYFSQKIITSVEFKDNKDKESFSTIGEPVNKNSFAWQASAGLNFRPAGSPLSINAGYRYYSGGQFNGPSDVYTNSDGFQAGTPLSGPLRANQI